MFQFNNEIPIFIQIAESIEDAILLGSFPEETQIPSTTEISVNYKINPATVLKGMNLLVDNGIVYKKRGLGVFVAKGAVEKIRQQREASFVKNYIDTLIIEAKKLGLEKQKLIKLINERIEDIEN